MKKLLFMLSALIFLMSSCASPDKLLEKGKYDKLVKKMIKKAEKRNGQVDHELLDAAFIAYERIQKSDSVQITHMIQKARSINDWKSAQKRLREVKIMQDDIAAVLPIRNEYGEVYNVRFLPVEKWSKHVSHNIEAIHYRDGLQYLEQARNGSKVSAKRALDNLRAVKNKNTFTELDRLISEARDLATVHILLENDRFSEMRNSDWQDIIRDRSELVVFYLPGEQAPRIDMVVDVKGFEYNIGFFNESVTKDNFSKEIVVRTETEKVWNAKDSVWTTEKKDVIEKVYATVISVEQIQESRGILDLFILDSSRKPLKREELVADNDFHNSFTFLEGDARALDHEFRPAGSSASPPTRFTTEGLLREQLLTQLAYYFQEADWWQIYDRVKT